MAFHPILKEAVINIPHPQENYRER